MVKKLLVCSVLAAALAVACGDDSGNPASPSAAVPPGANAAPDGSTLKASAPTAISPVNNQRLDTPEILLVVRNSTTSFSTPVALVYRFEVYNAAGVRVYQSGLVPGEADGTTDHAVTAQLEGDQTYQWQARAEFGGAFGPWSARAAFFLENTNGYIRGNELYDPLINGKTIGQIHGPVTFIPGLGVRLESQLSYISYELQQTLTEGEFSILVTGMPTNTDGNKTKLFAMAEGYSDIVVNDRRMTVEKRGDPPGVVAWRFITRDDQVDTEGPERETVQFDENQHYFWEATWRGNFFNLLIKEGGVNGPKIYDKGKHFVGGVYDPNPHVIYIGAPVGRSGEAGASVDHVIVRQVWVSNRPRPAFANK
jgi:hypothetical protein